MAIDPVEEVYRSDHGRLWRSLLAYTGDADLAAEAAAEAYTQALSRGDAMVDPRTWIWRSAFRIAGGLPGGRDPRPRPEVDRSGPDGRSVELQLVELLAQLATLSDQQRASVVLRYAGGFTPSEIADLLGTSPGTVRVELHRANAHLRERMEW